ncbi:hypothetical protein CLV43_10794 [Umezawaea tangerina]|uniref:Uncharacterized protein n=1 Tax=Umezawaea tangerina TaxID=84725 RepID=A0A2T0T1I9_9PSEU|nr:hypothetical protein CLV43_10794 [Umezawaea tangerina]
MRVMITPGPVRTAPSEQCWESCRACRGFRVPVTLPLWQLVIVVAVPVVITAVAGLG